jgi:Cu-Zn family superoxide dismutase
MALYIVNTGGSMKKWQKIIQHTLFIPLVLLVWMTACVSSDSEPEKPVAEAVAVIHPVGNSGVQGTVRFEEKLSETLVVANLTGLEPGKHGIHIHEYGDCSAPGAESAGGHFAPDGYPHGAPTDLKHHAGDLGNITADTAGVAHLELIEDRIKLNGKHSIIGRAVIIHAEADDFSSQPSGNAGERIGCGVIGITKYKTNL